ncbi:MAG: AmmeMemoRadiSam system radical SAM enzyme [Bacteroidales bacterium]
MKALFYTKINDDKIICNLCPHNCTILEGRYGICKVRKNVNGTLISENYGLISSLGFDPIEKKPLYHFYPGKEILSIGSVGCNLQCQFCQNYSISQTSIADYRKNCTIYSPEQIRDIALSHYANIGVAYTYNEPTIFFEFMLDTAKLIKSAGLKNVMVTNGFINPEPLKMLNNYIDAYNVDLKAFNNDFFRKYTKSELEPVKETLKSIIKAGKHLEITNLVIPTLNDSEAEFENMCRWIAETLGKEVVLHISRYFPTYKMTIEQTSIDRMILLHTIAKKYLNFVYIGNVLLDEGNNTYCSSCKELLISRKGYFTKMVAIDKSGNCSKCGNKVLKNS